MATRSTVAAAIALAACGRVGFDERDPRPGPQLADAGPGDAVRLPADALARCAQPAPFLRFVDAVMSPTAPGIYAIAFCAAGLPGPVTASIRHSDDGSVLVEAMGPIESGEVGLVLGGRDCSGCFARVTANGLVDDGPVTFFSGD